MGSLEEKFPPSQGCTCDICKSYCSRPGWWTVEQAKKAIESGLSHRMMMEISPDFKFAVLAPAFYGCEGFIATKESSINGCNFLKNGLCELHQSSLLPLECAFCHHERVGEGIKCHTAIMKEWYSFDGQRLVKKWQQIVKLDEKLKSYENNNDSSTS